MAEKESKWYHRLSESLFTSSAYDVLKYVLPTAATLMVTYLRQFYTEWASSVLFGLGAGLVVVIMLTIGRYGRSIQKPTKKIDPNNVEAEVRGWLDGFSLPVQKADDPETFFILRVNAPNNSVITVTRTKKFAGYLTFISGLKLSDAHAATLAKVSAEEARRFEIRLTMEAIRSGVGFVLQKAASLIMLERKIPITNALTEAVFLESFDSVMNAVTLLDAFIVLEMEQLEKAVKQSN